MHIVRNKSTVILRNHILTTYRLITRRWWLSIIKLCSLTIGIIAFLLTMNFLLGHENADASIWSLINSCTVGNLLVLSAIIVVTLTVYVLIANNQRAVRYREFFVRKLYGESGMGIASILLIETGIFLLFALGISHALLHEAGQALNSIGGFELRQSGPEARTELLIACVAFVVPGMLTVLLPAIRCKRLRTVDLLKLAN
jgi:hypothetical protein